MNAGIVDTLSRRASLAGLGAAGIAALHQPIAAGKNRNRKRKNTINKKAKQKCQQQVGPCTALVADECNGDPACLACCDFAGQCDFSGFIACLESQEA